MNFSPFWSACGTSIGFKLTAFVDFPPPELDIFPSDEANRKNSKKSATETAHNRAIVHQRRFNSDNAHVFPVRNVV